MCSKELEALVTRLVAIYRLEEAIKVHIEPLLGLFDGEQRNNAVLERLHSIKWNMLSLENDFHRSSHHYDFTVHGDIATITMYGPHPEQVNINIKTGQRQES